MAGFSRRAGPRGLADAARGRKYDCPKPRRAQQTHLRNRPAQAAGRSGDARRTSSSSRRPFWRRIPAYADVTDEQFLDHNWQAKNIDHEARQAARGAAGPRLGRRSSRTPTEGFARAPMSVRVSPVPAVAHRLERPVRRSAAQPVHPARLAPAARSPEARPRLAARAGRRAGRRASRTATPTRRSSSPLDTCPVYCRFCTRSYAVGVDTEEVEKVALQGRRGALAARLRVHRLAPRARGHRRLAAATRTTCAPSRSREIGETLLEMPNIRRIRFATKGPAVMPQKILTDDAWIDALTARRRARAASCTRRSCSTRTSTTRTRSPASPQRRDGQALRARHHRAQPERAPARRERHVRDDEAARQAPRPRATCTRTTSTCTTS